MNTIGSGVISGVLASLLVLVVSRIWFTQVIPWYEARVYNGIMVSGKWLLNTEVADGPQWVQTESIDLKQNAHRLRGLSVVRPREGESGEERIFEVDGETMNRFIVLNARVSDHKRLGIQALLLEVTEDGRKLSGGAVYYDVHGRTIKTAPVEYRREG